MQYQVVRQNSLIVLFLNRVQITEKTNKQNSYMLIYIYITKNLKSYDEDRLKEYWMFSKGHFENVMSLGFGSEIYI